MSELKAENLGGETSNRSRILVVDDELPIRIVAQRILERLGHEVTLATNPAEALQLAANGGASFDLALIDVNLAGESGLVLAIELQRLVGDMPVVIMGGNLERGMLGGTVRRLLPKPFALSDLSEAIASVTQQGANGDSVHGDTCLSGPDAARILG